MLPISPNLNLSNNERTDLTGTQSGKTGGAAGGSGLRSSIVNNLAFGGSSLEASASDNSTKVPWWIWGMLIGVFAVLGWKLLKR
jgi:hypothetical protein